MACTAVKRIRVASRRFDDNHVGDVLHDPDDTDRLAVLVDLVTLVAVGPVYKRCFLNVAFRSYGTAAGSTSSTGSGVAM